MMKRLLLLALLLVSLFAFNIARADDPTPTDEPSATPSEPQFTAMDVIEEVNSLRETVGLPALTIHPVLMEIAQTEANGIAAGYGGHWRPNDMTLGQWLLSLGYPLSGDLSMDGYRSENWFMADLSTTSDDVLTWWRGDQEHSDTMFSNERSDIGAAIAVDADGQVVVVLETALRTASGKMQSDAYPILTGIPATKMAYADMLTQAAINGVLPQYSIPVKLSTAGPDGNVYHTVKYGQSLWSIAVGYHTTIKEIMALNGLTDTGIREGQKLLVQKGATPPPPPSDAGRKTAAAPVTQAAFVPVPAVVPSPLPTPTHGLPPRDTSKDTLSFGAIAVAGLVLAGVFVAMTRKGKPGKPEGQ